MTSDIPDDVVERALSTYWDADWTGACMDETYKGRTDAMRAALRVAVEWERERCAMVADEYTHGNEDEYDYADIGKVVAAKNIAAAIRALKEKQV